MGVLSLLYSSSLIFRILAKILPYPSSESN